MPPPPAETMTARQLAQWTRQLLVTAAEYKERLDALRQWYGTVNAGTPPAK